MSHFLRSSESCPGVRRNTHFVHFLFMLRLLGGEAAPPPLTPDQLLSSGRKSGAFLPTVSIQPWQWSNAPPCLKKKKKHDCTSVAVVGRYLARLDGWRSDLEAFIQFSASKTSHETNPFLWLPLPSCSRATYMLPYSICNQTLLRWFCILAVFEWLFDYLACLSSQLQFHFVCTRTVHSSVLPL